MSSSLSLGDNLNRLKGIGPKKTKALNDLGLFNVSDLLSYYPYKYQDRRKITKIKDLKMDETFQIEGKVLSLKLDSKGYSKKSGRLRLLCEDDTGKISIVFFNGGYLINTFKKNEHYIFYGKANKYFGKNTAYKYQLTNPDYVKKGSDNDIRGIIPIYKTTKGIGQRDMHKWIVQALELVGRIKEWVPEDILNRNNMCDIKYALSNIHYPKDEKAINISKYRIIYGDFLIYKLSQKYNSGINNNYKYNKIEKKEFDKLNRIIPFELTKGQLKAIEDINSDLIDDKPMNRLLQGDVGSGKTIVAQYSIFTVLENGYQGAYMAPTEILANQVYAKMLELFKSFDYNIAIMTGSTKAKDKALIKERLKSGDINLIIGTHSLIQEDVDFKNLMLTVIDEQHRFGVDQRRLLTQKGNCPNILVMSATPIPRTLAATVYGDMDFSVIDTIPMGRKQIITKVYNSATREKAYVELKNELLKGHQGYVVAPLIEDSEELELISINEIFDELKKRYKGFRLGLLHGRLKTDEKNRLMAEFSKGDIDLLVSTIVIEVGIDVNNATAILIENAERFGLAQLHQLRGRVGRNSLQSYCHLISYSDSKISKTRMKAMKEYSCGFDISEEDFKLRGPGDIYGTTQHGNNLDMDNFVRYIEILEKAGKDADELLTNDKMLSKTENKLLKDIVERNEVFSYKDII
jgi:ATP-dependent DNA helicase RecG